MKKDIFGVVGLILFLYGIISAILFSNVFWYSWFVVGGTLFIGYINHRFKRESIIKEFEKNKIKLFKIYLFYLFTSILIEIIGRFIFNLWEYPHFGQLEVVIHVFLIGYPFAFFFIYESFIFIKGLIKDNRLSIFLTILISSFLHETPNTFSLEWIYHVPYVTLEIFKINVVVIFAWSFLILASLIGKKIIR